MQTKVCHCKRKQIIEKDARYTQMVGTSLLQFILKKPPNVRKISARRLPHLLKDDQKKH